jgi:DNA-dependent metalloprotease WSS1
MGLLPKSPRTPLPSNLPGPNPLISIYTHLSSLERADEALEIIHQLASRVKPIMRKRNWKVGTLAEFLPDHYALQGFSPSNLFI